MNASSNKFLFHLFVFTSLIYAVHSESKDGSDDQLQAPEFKNMYTKMFLEKRKAQHEAVKRIADLGNKKKENEMLKLVLNKLFETLKISLENLAKKNKDDGKKLRIDKETIEDVSSVIENTAFASDLALRFPKYFHKAYDKNKSWQFTLETSISITLQSKLADETTEKAVYLMSQELNIIDKEPNYFNPYSSKKIAEEPLPTKEILKKKEKKKRGPGLSGGKLDL
ncbi:coiled-coil domain-containing protein [Brachionus plicatilis]|uniref:Coiled-coil domain-containing protein n=1 Tax=Brachionus plicatilis TaxID=10195 RepID=A0A3M7Q9W2_BRAPC|nr:coiled-coil domain-containing protein [Brachionus plicatilis]